MDNPETNTLRLRRLGIETHQEAVVYMHEESPLCRSEGFEAQSRVEISLDGRSIIASIKFLESELPVAKLLGYDEAGLSEIAWQRLGRPDGAEGKFSHPPHVESLSDVRAKIYGETLGEEQLHAIIRDIVDGRYTDVHLAAFLSASAGGRMTVGETVGLTRAMIASGERLHWAREPIVDKHCIGGLPGNRTTPLIVSIATSCGLTMPKTSSRAITSPAGTADTMATLTAVDLSLDEIRSVVDREGGCIVWGGAAGLSPADSLLIRIERALDLDSPNQLVASILSKKAAAGSTHVVIDIPVGPTAKARTGEAAADLHQRLDAVAGPIGLELSVVHTDGRQPVGRGIGPALEARDVLDVLQNHAEAPTDLRERAVRLAGRLLEQAEVADPEKGAELAEEVIASGRAWRKFQAICEAQGGLRRPPSAEHVAEVTAETDGVVEDVDNRRLARTAKLAGAPDAPAAGVEFLAPLETRIERGQPLFVVHAETPGELQYALEYVDRHPNIVEVREP